MTKTVFLRHEISLHPANATVPSLSFLNNLRHGWEVLRWHKNRNQPLNTDCLLIILPQPQTATNRLRLGTVRGVRKDRHAGSGNSHGTVFPWGWQRNSAPLRLQICEVLIGIQGPKVGKIQ